MSKPTLKRFWSKKALDALNDPNSNLVKHYLGIDKQSDRHTEESAKMKVELKQKGNFIFGRIID